MEPIVGKSFDSFKELGNQLFLKTSQNENLSPVIYQQRMCEALQFYNKAGNFATSAQQVSSIRKNVAFTQLRIAEKLNPAYFRQVLRRSTTNQMRKDLQFFLEEALKNFEEAMKIGLGVQSPAWTAQVRERKHQCAHLLWNFLLKLHDGNDFSVLCGRLHQVFGNLIGSVRAELFLQLGRLTFNKAVEYQEDGKVVESLQLLHDNYLNIEEAKKLDAQLNEAGELEDSNIMHLCIGDSSLARQKGDKLWEEATCENENIQMELVGDTVDCYVQSIVLSRRGKCLENEAMAHSQLGRLYELLVMNVKSNEHYKLTVDLVVAMEPRNFNSHSWYKQALAGLNKFQREQHLKKTKERELQRAPIRAELKDELDELKKASSKSPQNLLDLLYSKHPPKRGEKSADSQMKTKLKMALLHFHPDKQDVEVHGLKWVVLTEEITILLTYHFGNFKN